ncbi:RFC checkpoint protein Rad17 [Sporothrix epigloea]|uniref:RFC checkpoint protein Rad17 n=1 Tax=Sporothrix epigloea TaxID=1892477 RepID=A0ABP0DWL1_9PEZI
MPPRRKRTVLDDSDSEEETAREQRKTSLRNFFSPNSKNSSALDTSPAKLTAATPSPSPARRTRATAAKNATTPTRLPAKRNKVSGTATSPSASLPFGRILTSRAKDNNATKSAPYGDRNASSPRQTPEKVRSSKSIQNQTDEKGRSADLVALFTKQAKKAQESPKKKVPPAVDEFSSDPIVSDDNDTIDGGIADCSAVAGSYVGSRAQKRWKSSNHPGVGGSSQQMPTLTPTYSNGMAPPSQSSSSQRFKRPGRPAALNGTSTTNSEDDLRPWSERFAPVNLDELAVHKKKVADVRQWLEDVLLGRLRQRLLVLKGAAGTGKTTTLRLLAKDMDLDILEWRNPTGAYMAGAASMGYTSAAAQFEEFLNHGSKFSQLDLEDGSSDSGNSSLEAKTTAINDIPHGGASGALTSQRHKLIVIEEFPNTFMRSSSALTGFRNSILQYLAANTPSLAAYAQRRASFDQGVNAPVVMIVSETLLTTTSASADSFTAHRLLGPEILRHPGTGLIEFNAVAPSLLAKALELIVQKEARKSGRRRTPGPLVLKRLGEVGDVRSAVASLEFLCVKGDEQGDWGAKVSFTKTRKGPKDTALTQGERETLEMVSRREASLGVFHAVGKVVYNKRVDLPPPAGSDAAVAEMLPPHFAHHARPKPSLVDVDTLIDEIGTDTHTFISALHENYVLSCEQTGTRDAMSSIDYISGCIEYLSESDLLCPTWDIFFGGRGSNRSNFGLDSGSQVLRQDETAFQVAVRGLLFSLPSPVKRSSASHYQRGGPTNGGDASGSGLGAGGGTGSGGSQFKMFYPMSLKLWRTREEMEALVDVWSSKLLRGEVSRQDGSNGPALTQAGLKNSSLPFRRPPPKFSSRSCGSSRTELGENADRKAAIKREDTENHSSANGDVTATNIQSQSPPPPLLSLGSSARKELLLERLPYMALIARGQRSDFESMSMRDLEKVVSFHGIGGAAAGTAADEADEDAADAHCGIGAGGSGLPADQAWATDKPTDENTSPRKARRPPTGQKGWKSAAAKGAPEEELDGLPVGLPMYNLALSDDDIEDVD